MWLGARAVIPNATVTLGNIPSEINDNEGIIFYADIVSKNNDSRKILRKLSNQGVKSNRIILITCICSNKGLNEIAREFPEQIIYTSCIDEEEESTNIIKPGIGNPIFRLSTKFE